MARPTSKDKDHKICPITGAPIRPLNRREQLFLEIYMANPGMPAYHIAKQAEFSESTAKSRPAKWVGNDVNKVEMDKRMLWKAIQEAGRKRARKAKIDADYVLKRFHEIAEMDVADIFDDEWNLKPISQWPAAWRKSISALEVTRIRKAAKKGQAAVEDVIKHIKWPAKDKALEMLGKHVKVGAFSEIHLNVETSHEEWLKSLK